jgi:hypothetical protein
MRLLTAQFVVLTLAALTATPAPAADEATPPSGAVVIYTKDNAPATPKLDALPLKESISEVRHHLDLRETGPRWAVHQRRFLRRRPRHRRQD